MSDNIPPMTVWLDRCASGVRTLGFYSPDKSSLHVEGNVTTFGPYVHLEQFMAEVERRSRRSTFLYFDNDEENPHKAMQELAKEIMEGKA